MSAIGCRRRQAGWEVLGRRVGRGAVTPRRGADNMTCDVECGRWESLPLLMSRRGVDAFKRLTEKTLRQPMVYVHVEMQSRGVLRIGKAEKGIHRRWATDPNGHFATFEWATTKSGPYGPKLPSFHTMCSFSGCSTGWRPGCGSLRAARRPSNRRKGNWTTSMFLSGRHSCVLVVSRE